MSKNRLITLAGVAVVAALAFWLWPRGYCRSAERTFGIEVPVCPDGRPRHKLQLQGQGLRRGGSATVRVFASAMYTTGDAMEVETAPIDGFDVDLTLIDPAGKETALQPDKGTRWRTYVGSADVEITLPPGPDGDYRLRATVRSGVGKDTVDLALPLYAPARIHVITDRPLYQPGSLVSFRALALRATDLAPIDQRPGTWIVRNPAQEVLLEEKAPAGAWGVVAGDFPLDRGAVSGEWSVTWKSGADEATRTFRVEPFSLPRFRVEAAADRPFYGPRDTPILRGAVTYSSGAPVAGAAVAITWRVDSEGWPAPTGWASGGLPVHATTGDNGRFELRLPEVPGDLLGQARLVASLTATDASGDRIGGAATVLLSQDAIQVQAITELDDGLVAGFNNRVYLRVTTADGRPLAGAAVRVRRAWSASDPGIAAVLDEDAVARIQLDPGPPVNVVVPPQPVRPPPAPPAVIRTTQRDLVTGDPPSLADLIALDGWTPAIAACTRWVSDSATATLALQIDESGRIAATETGDSAAERCVLATVRGRRLPAGPRRMLALTYQLRDVGLPTIAAEYEEPVDGDEDLRPLDAALLDARDCLPDDADGEVPWTLTLQIARGARQVRTSWNRPAGAEPLSPALRACLDSRLARAVLPSAADEDHLAMVTLSITRPDSAAGGAAPQPTILQGYELAVAASIDGRALGETRLRMTPGSVPALRLRATPVLARAGEPIAVELIRGPDFTGDLPEEITLEHLGDSDMIKVDAKTRTATAKLPADARGWYRFMANGASARVYVRSDQELAVSVSPDRATYRPGDDARLAIHTALGGRGAAAAVGLFGVDASLAQLAPLPGADDMRSLRPEIEMVAPAFGVLDAQALTLGRVRGSAAAEATVLRVSAVPTPAQLDAAVTAEATSAVDPVAELTDRFYRVLSELHAQTRAWERTAPAAEQMTPETMATLWSRAVAAVKASGASVEDAFGRTLRLRYLPPSLLALVDPRQVVVSGTRLPEDTANWSAWVERRKP